MLNGNSTVRVCPDASPIFNLKRKVLSSRMRPLTRKSSEPPLRRGSPSFSDVSFVSLCSAIDAKLSLLADRDDNPNLDFGRGSPPGASLASLESSSRLPEGDGFSEFVLLPKGSFPEASPSAAALGLSPLVLCAVCAFVGEVDSDPASLPTREDDSL